MSIWTKDTLTTGAIAATATTTAVAVLSKKENGVATSAINAVSHMIWGKEATRIGHLDARHTLVGVGLNAAAVTVWAGMHELILSRSPKPSTGGALLAGAATSAFAYWVDYHVVPKRFTPGFEKRLSRNSVFVVYAVLALSLAVGSLMRGESRSDDQKMR